MKKSLLRILTLALSIAMLMVSVAFAQDNAITYDAQTPVNNGETINVEFWYWTGGANLFTALADAYMAVHPNVTITLVENPWDQYWTKLPLALQGNDGPAIFNVHNSQHDNLIGYMAPYDVTLDDLTKDYVGVAAHAIDGEVYYTDYGLMTATMYYNKAMWEAAGLTEADIPTTWDQFREVAKKLTIRDDSGALTQAGFSFNGGAQGDVLGLQYQYGQNLFTADGKQVTFNNDAIKSVVQRMKDFYEVDGIGDYNFGNNSGDNFGQGMVALYMGWGFMHNVLASNFPDVQFGNFEIPTVTGEVPYAYNRYNGESTFGVNKNASVEQQAVAQDVVKFFLASDDLVKQFCLANSVFPAKKSLAADADILNVSSIAVLANHIDRYIWPGTMPSSVENNMKIALEDIFYNGADLATALQSAEDTCNMELSMTDFVSVEAQYQYAGEAK